MKEGYREKVYLHDLKDKVSDIQENTQDIRQSQNIQNQLIKAVDVLEKTVLELSKDNYEMKQSLCDLSRQNLELRQALVEICNHNHWQKGVVSQIAEKHNINTSVCWTLKHNRVV